MSRLVLAILILGSLYLAASVILIAIPFLVGLTLFVFLVGFASRMIEHFRGNSKKGVVTTIEHE